MLTYKMTATVLSAAILAACAQTPYHAALIEEKRAGRIVCEYEAPINSRIKRKTCRVVRDLTLQEQEDMVKTF